MMLEQSACGPPGLHFTAAVDGVLRGKRQCRLACRGQIATIHELQVRLVHLVGCGTGAFFACPFETASLVPVTLHSVATPPAMLQGSLPATRRRRPHMLACCTPRVPAAYLQS